MKKILVTQRLIENDAYKEIREALDINCSKLLYDAGYLPVILPYEVDINDYFKNLDIDGVLLTGGNDLYSVNKSELSKKRDKFEYSLIELAIKFEIPLLGICRGMQIVANYFGSKLEKVNGQVNIKHPLIINKESTYYKELSNLSLVNSFHNFAVTNLSEELIVSATNEQNIIKAIEHTKHKIFCQMWHSERENSFNKDEIKLIQRVFND